MRIGDVQKKIAINLIISGVLLIVISVGVIFNIRQRQALTQRVEMIRSEAALIQNRTQTLQNRSVEIKRYTDLWQKIDQKKRNVTGIKMDELNANIGFFADRYGIKDHSIKVALPEQMKDGSFNRATVNVFFTTVTLEFNAPDDLRALYFIKGLVDSLPGYVVITSMYVKKTGEYTPELLSAISTGSGSGIIKGNVNFVWYAYKEKDSSKNANITKSQ